VTMMRNFACGYVFNTLGIWGRGLCAPERAVLFAELPGFPRTLAGCWK